MYFNVIPVQCSLEMLFYGMLQHDFNFKKHQIAENKNIKIFWGESRCRQLEGSRNTLKEMCAFIVP